MVTILLHVDSQTLIHWLHGQQKTNKRPYAKFPSIHVRVIVMNEQYTITYVFISTNW